MSHKPERLLAISLALALFLILTSSFHLQAAPIANAKRTLVTIQASIVPLNSMTITAITPLTKNDVWITGNYINAGQAQIFYEHFNGKQWSVIASPTIGATSTIANMSAITTNNIWAVGSYQDSTSHALIEHWDGAQWSQINIPDPVDFGHDSHLNAVTALSVSNIWAVGNYYTNITAQNDITLIEHFDGTQWQVVAGDNPPVNGINPWFSSRSVVSMTAVNPTNIWSLALFSFGVSFAEHYDGSQWTLMQMPNINGGNGDSTILPSISAVSANDVWAVGSFSGSNESGPVTEHWNGTDWFYVSMQHLPGITQTLTSVIALQTNNVWAIGTYSNGHVDQPLLVHWNGTTWNTVTLPHSLSKIFAIQRLGTTHTLMGVGIYNNTMKLFTLNGAYFSM
jgi:hypothetical protein